jgi:hypothetical protein
MGAAEALVAAMVVDVAEVKAVLLDTAVLQTQAAWTQTM